MFKLLSTIGKQSPCPRSVVMPAPSRGLSTDYIDLG